MYRYKAVGLAFYDPTTSDISRFYKVRICCWRKYHFWGLTCQDIVCSCPSSRVTHSTTWHPLQTCSWVEQQEGTVALTHLLHTHRTTACSVLTLVRILKTVNIIYTPLPHTFMFSQETLGLQCKCEDILSQTIQLEGISLVACMYTFNCFYCISKVF